MIGFPLDSHVTYDTDGTPVFDRAITSAPYRSLLGSLFSNGVSKDPDDSFKVEEASGGMIVRVNPGFAMVNGCMKLEDEIRTLSFTASHDTKDRIDTVVLRLNDNDSVRSCDLYVVAGNPAVTPVRPTLTRTGSIYEIGLADVYINSGATSISAEKITDTRYEEGRCGKISIQADIGVDSELSSTSTNPVQNRVVKAAIDNIWDNLNVKVENFDEENQKLYLVGV